MFFIPLRAARSVPLGRLFSDQSQNPSVAEAGEQHLFVPRITFEGYDGRRLRNLGHSPGTHRLVTIRLERPDFPRHVVPEQMRHGLRSPTHQNSVRTCGGTTGKPLKEAAPTHGLSDGTA
jgi:hypothetical protein